MAVLAPTPQWINNAPAIATTPQVATSQFSAGGVMSPTTTVAQAINPNNPIGFNNNASNPFYSQTIAPQPQQNGPSSGLLSNASSLNSAGRFVSNGFSLPQSTMLNSFGADLGFASAVNGAPAASGAIGPTLSGANAGTLGTSATLSSTLGAAGIGAFAGNFLGKIGGNATGGSIGGGVGAGIGMAVGGPVGAIVGGLIGGIGGGFFGNKKKPTSASEFSGVLNDTGDVTGFTYGAKNAGSYTGYNETLSQEMASYMSEMKPLLGLNKYTPLEIKAGVDTMYSPSGKPGFIKIGKANGPREEDIAYTIFGFNPDDVKDKQKAINEAMIFMAKQSGATNDQIQSALSSLASQQTQSTNTNIPNKKEATNTAWSDFITNYKNSIKPQGTNNATTTNPASAV